MSIREAKSCNPSLIAPPPPFDQRDTGVLSSSAMVKKQREDCKSETAREHGETREAENRTVESVVGSGIIPVKNGEGGRSYKIAQFSHFSFRRLVCY